MTGLQLVSTTPSTKHLSNEKHLIRRKEMIMRDDAKNVTTTEGNQAPMEESNDVGDRTDRHGIGGRVHDEPLLDRRPPGGG